MRKIKIVCATGSFAKFRALKLVIDGKNVDSIKQGKAIEIEIPDDAVELRGKMDWGMTEPILLTNVKEGDIVTFKPYFTLNLLRSFGISTLPIRVGLTES